MLDPKIFDDLSQRLAASLPLDLQVMQQDVERNLKSALESALGRLNLITMEEFEVQRTLLARTKEQLHRLEARVQALETRLEESDRSSD